MIETVECPNCGEMLFAEDLEAGQCTGCGMEFETEDAA